MLLQLALLTISVATMCAPLSHTVSPREVSIQMYKWERFDGLKYSNHYNIGSFEPTEDYIRATRVCITIDRDGRGFFRLNLSCDRLIGTLSDSVNSNLSLSVATHLLGVLGIRLWCHRFELALQDHFTPPEK